MDFPGLTTRLLGWAGATFEGHGGLLTRFVVASLLFVVVTVALRPRARAWGQVAASLALLAWFTTPVLAAGAAAYLLCLFWAIEHLPPGWMRVAAVVGLLVLQVVGPIFWLPGVPGYVGPVREFAAFATNMTLLRAWAYADDRLRRPGAERPSLRDYAHFMLFFPAFANGPLLSFRQFQRARLAGYWEGDGAAHGLALLAREWRGALRVGLGLAASAAAFYFVCIPGMAGYDVAAEGGTRAAWAQALRVYVCIYLGFTAWTEAAIGLARLSGVALPENFAAPHLSYGVADFWRRWNITLGHWLRDHVYLPLGGAYPRRGSGARRPEWMNTAAVFAVMAVYHVQGALKLLGFGYYPPRAWIPWTLWAGLNTVGVIATRRLERPARLTLGAAGVVGLTLAFACVGHLTAFFPPGLDLAKLGALYRHLLALPQGWHAR